MKHVVKTNVLTIALVAITAVSSHAQSPVEPATLVQTIDLGAWTGTPATVVQPPPPQPAPGFSVTGIAFDPAIGMLYVGDYATTNVYQIDAVTRAVTAAVYTNGLYTTADIGPTQDVPGTAPTVVLANPQSNRWLFTGEKGGAAFNGIAFAEPLTPRAMQSGAAWDPATDNVYAADGLNWFATNNAKFLFAGGGGCNAVAVNPATSRVYVSCGGAVSVYDGFALSKASVKVPTPPLAVTPAPTQVLGLAVNPNTNRLYVGGPSSLEVLDASTYAHIASIPGLPDQSGDFLIAGYMALPLPRPIAVNTRTNTIFVVNSVSSTITVVDGATNAVTGTIVVPVPDGAVVSVPYPPQALLSDIKPGNTIFASAPNALQTLGGAIAIAVNEAANLLYVASVNGTVGVYALSASTNSPAFSVNGVIKDQTGTPVSGVTVRATGANAVASAITDGSGMFVVTGLPAGTYSISPASAAFAFSPSEQAVTVDSTNLTGLSFTANPPIVPATYTLAPWTTIGAGVSTTATVTLNQAAPAGGAVLTLSVSDPKAAKVPATVTVPGGQSSVSFAVQASGVSTTTVVTLSASYNGATANTALVVAPGDTVRITSATYSRSQQLLQIKATSTSAVATLLVQNASSNAVLGAMTNLGGGNYIFQLGLGAGVPSSVNVSSSLGGKTGQGITLIP